MWNIYQETKRNGQWVRTGLLGTYQSAEQALKVLALCNRQQSPARRYVVDQD